MLTVVHDAQEANDKATGHRSLLDEIVRDDAEMRASVPWAAPRASRSSNSDARRVLPITAAPTKNA